jgi:DNA-binding PadR family transcriptional regulator
MNDDSVNDRRSAPTSGASPVSDFDQCVCSGKTLGRLLRPAILAALSQSPAHGYVLVQRMTELDLFSGGPPDPSGVYRTLKDMEREGLVASAWEAGDVGPAKRRFELTLDGAACLARWTTTLQRYRSQIDGLLGLLRSRPGSLPLVAPSACACRAKVPVEKGRLA